MRIPVGVDPSETWEVDYCRADAEIAIERYRARIAALEREPPQLLAKPGETPVDLEARARARDEARARALELTREALSVAEAELAAYVPETGPIFVVGHIPGAKRAELQDAAEDRDTSRAANFTWAREVVRWAVRGHRNLKAASGKDLPFVSEQAEFDGEAHPVVSKATLAQYAPILESLAAVVLLPQQLGGAEKNG